MNWIAYYNNLSRNINIRKAVRKVHLWLGPLSGLVLSIMDIAGSIYVVMPEITGYHKKNWDHYQKESRMVRKLKGQCVA